MSKHAHIIEEFLKEEDLRYTTNSDNTYFLIQVATRDAKCCVAISITKGSRISMRTTFPMIIPENRREIVMRHITQLNYTLFLGKYEFDLSDGDLVYATSLMVDEDDDIPQSIIEHLFRSNVVTYASNQNHILALALNGSTKRSVGPEEKSHPSRASGHPDAPDDDESGSCDDDMALDAMIRDAMDAEESTKSEKQAEQTPEEGAASSKASGDQALEPPDGDGDSKAT